MLFRKASLFIILLFFFTSNCIIKMMKCFLCPRECGADRDKDETGVCGVDNKIYIARAALHMWEEPCISGAEGSGAIFFFGCSLGCIYCQNYEISHGLRVGFGKEINSMELADLFFKLQKEGANNINLVTPTHYSNQIIEAVKAAKDRGCGLPIVYNCSGYEKVDTLNQLEGIVDIYLTDFKYMDDVLAEKYSKARNYPEVAKNALREMHRQQPNVVFDDRGIMQKGIIVRNLLLPGHVNNSKAVCEYVYNTYGDDVYLSIMNQYTPLPMVRGTNLDRKVTKREYDRLVDYMLELGVKNAFIQEGDVAKESFIPDWE